MIQISCKSYKELLRIEMKIVDSKVRMTFCFCREPISLYKFKKRTSSGFCCCLLGGEYEFFSRHACNSTLWGSNMAESYVQWGLSPPTSVILGEQKPIHHWATTQRFFSQIHFFIRSFRRLIIEPQIKCKKTPFMCFSTLTNSEKGKEIPFLEGQTLLCGAKASKAEDDDLAWIFPFDIQATFS